MACRILSRPDEPTIGDVLDALKFAQTQQFVDGITDELTETRYALLPKGKSSSPAIVIGSNVTLCREQKQSILDPFAERLTQWLYTPKEDGGDGLTLTQAREQLQSDGCSISVGRLSEWWSQKQKRDVDKKFLANIANGSKMSKEVKAAFADNPPPEIQTLVNVVQSLIMTLQVKGEANPKYLEMADRLLASVLEFARMQTTAGFEKLKIEIRQTAEARAERALKLEREKFALALKKADAYDRAQAALTEGKKSKGGITPETLKKIETELRLL